MKEIWKDIKGFEGVYQASNEGRVKSLKFNKERILSQTKDNGGYYHITYQKDKIRATQTVHRFIAEAFIPNSENKRTINHINGIKTDNRVVNLEWATYSENHKHAFRIGLKIPNKIKGKLNKINKSVIQISIDGKALNKYYSITNANQSTGVSISSISCVCRGLQTTAGGFMWKFG